MFERFWDSFVAILMAIFLPMICVYHAICGNIFLNVSAQNATGLEQAGNIILTPFQYLFAGKEAILQDDGSWELSQKFSYDTHLLPKTVASAVLLPSSLILGSAIKGLSLLSSETQNRYHSLSQQKKSTTIRSNQEFYQTIGIETQDMASAPFITSQGYQRRPGDENHLSSAKECLKDVAKVLTEANIPWWVDCGTLLGAYRYGGVIPWDNDIDIAVLLPDFENARRAFNHLDTAKYMVQDWSGRDFPGTFFKIYVRKTGEMIDIYFYDIRPQDQTCSYIFSMDKTIFFFEWWKKGERRFTKPSSFAHIFPLKRALFDGIEVFVPNNPIPFLQRYYGENLAPARIYDPITNRFEKDLSHPYWQNPYVH